MWILYPAISLAIVHIAGGNLAVVPDMAGILGMDIYITTILAYFIFGSILAGLSSWIGIRSGQELSIVINRMFGCPGKMVMAVLILAISIPASALTGGYFAGWLLHKLTGLPHAAAIPVCLLIFSALAAGYGHDFLKFSNYVSLLLMPMVIGIFLFNEIGVKTVSFYLGKVDWVLLCALVGYNSGGLHSFIVVETAAYLTKRGYKAIYLTVLAKWIEGLFTLVLAHLALLTGTQGPLAISGVVGKIFGVNVSYIFNMVLLCTFINTMAPAMLVNARQLSIITGLSFWPSLLFAYGAVAVSSYIDLQMLVVCLSFSGLAMASFIVYTAYCLHKWGMNQL